MTQCELYYIHKSTIDEIIVDNPGDIKKGFISEIIKLKRNASAGGGQLLRDGRTKHL